MITKKQAQAEQAIHEALDANDPDTCHSFAEFALENMDTIKVTDLLVAIHSMPLNEWESMLSKMHGSVSRCIRDLAIALDLQRAKFMEYRARENVATAEAQRGDPYDCAHDFNCRGECFR